MNCFTEKIAQNKSQAASISSASSKPEESSLENIQPKTTSQKSIQDTIGNNQRVKQLRGYQAVANNSPQVKQLKELQGAADSYSSGTVQRLENLEEETLQAKSENFQKKENKTGLPDNLKSGIESLSGYSLDQVKIHYNSDRPAQLQAHAYAQGSDIHIAPGQEKHLAHEAWHVVQQAQGRVKPTMQMKGNVQINDDAGLEKEADFMGAKAQNSVANHQTGEYTAIPVLSTSSPIQGRFLPNGEDFDNANENTLDGFLTHNNIPNHLFTKDQYAVLLRAYRSMRVKARTHANDQDQLDVDHQDFADEAQLQSVLFAPLAWEVGGVQRANRYEITLSWQGRHGNTYNKILHCSFRHVFWNYFVDNYASNALNTMVDDETTFSAAFKAYADAFPFAFRDDRRTVNAAVANAPLGAGNVNFNVDMGLAAGASEIHSYPVATPPIAYTFNQATHASLKDVMAVYFNRKGTTPAILAAWNLVKADPNVVAMYGQDWVDQFTALVTP